jgi:hypothetical protein
VDGGTVQGLQFQGAVANVTGISGNLVRTRVGDCEFWTTLSYGVDGHGLLSRITDCRFGLAGDVPDHPFQHIRIRSADGSTNAWEIDHCAFYNATADAPSRSATDTNSTSITTTSSGTGRAWR